MSKFRCTCGHIIVDQTDYLSYKGMVIKDQDSENFLSGIVGSCASLAEALQQDRRTEWIDENFGSDYPRDLDNSSMINDLISRLSLKYCVHVLECEQCGRIYVQEEPAVNSYAEYARVTPRKGCILASKYSSNHGRSNQDAR